MGGWWSREKKTEDSNRGNKKSRIYESPDIDYSEELVVTEVSEEIIAVMKIRGGKTVRPGQIPYIVSLQSHSREHPHFCGASIIHPLILLTAAHCFVGMSKLEGMIAVSGEHRLSVHEGTEQIRNITQLIRHENWDARTVNNDIALLVLDHPLEFNKYTRPIRIPVPNAPLPRPAHVSGWGYVNRTGNSADVLQFARISFRNRTTCEELFGQVNLGITDSMICAGGARDACELDSGGPLECRSNSCEPFLCGIVSWGVQGCFKSGLPGVYTDVSRYHHWITSHLQEILKNRPNAQASKACGVATSLDPHVTCFTCGERIKGGKSGRNSTHPYIVSFRVHADIQHRYSRTQVTSIMVNPDETQPQKVSFSVFFPETAFISHFSITIDGIDLKACTEGKNTARHKYGRTNKVNQTAEIVKSSYGNLFNVTRRLPPRTIVNITLAYEELISRRAGVYEQNIQIDVEKVRVAKSFEITAAITDSHNITLLRALGISSGMKIDQEIEGANVFWNGNVGAISWSPQANNSHIPQRFVLQYDTAPEADVSSGKVLIRDGHFAHFFSPVIMPSFEKYLIFVLELSGSMDGGMLSELKTGVGYMLNGLDRRDRFSIITFNDNVKVWLEHGGYRHAERAKKFIEPLKGAGGANLHEALMKALSLTTASHMKPIIVLFSTGNVTTGITSQNAIQSQVAALNSAKKYPIYSLSLGPSSDFSFLQKLSLQNNGFARKFHPDLDHPQQLSDFYVEISSPLLIDLNFTYSTSNSSFKASDVTAIYFPIYFKGNDIVVAGKLVQSSYKAGKNDSELMESDDETDESKSCNTGVETDFFSATVHGRAKDGLRVFRSSQPIDCNRLLHTTSSFMERLWAYLTIKELLYEAETMTHDQLDEMRKRGCEGPRRYAQRLALKYGFVTPVTSLVIIQPNVEDEVVESLEMNVLAVRAGMRTVMDDNQQGGEIHCAEMQPELEVPPASAHSGSSSGNSSF